MLLRILKTLLHIHDSNKSDVVIRTGNFHKGQAVHSALLSTRDVGIYLRQYHAEYYGATNGSSCYTVYYTVAIKGI
jgi:hypothetical protein